MTFEELKARKLKRLIGLRIFNALGMVSWLETSNGDAKQRLRLVHPFTWVWFTVTVIFSIFAQGIPGTISDLKSVWEREVVWF